MAEKDLSSTPQAQTPFPTTKTTKRTPRKKSAPHYPHVEVRSEEALPPELFEYFKMDPRTGQALGDAEKKFMAQVYMHEIDEGVRLLQEAGLDREAKTVSNFSNKMHPSHRLDLLREILADVQFRPKTPQRIHHVHKARNNQWGAIKTKLGRLPALAITEIGVGYKDWNEDAFLMLPSQKTIALADGMGGHVGGNVASCIAIDFFEYAIKQGMDLEQAVAFSNEAILARSKSDPRLGGMHPMGCTFAGIQLRHSLLQVAHVGDTKVLVVRDGKVHFQTQDHTQGQQLLQEGLVDLPTAFELNHILNRCLGLDRMQAQRDVAGSKIFLEPGDRILLLTDGITDNFFDEKFSLESVAHLAGQGSLAQAADLIIESCYQYMTGSHLPNGRSPKPDNISLAMVEYRG